VEHSFRVIKRQFGYTQVRYRGPAKNAAQVLMLFALSNLWMKRKQFFAAHGEIASMKREVAFLCLLVPCREKTGLKTGGVGAPTPPLQKVSADFIGTGQPLISEGFRDRHWTKVRGTSANCRPNSVTPTPLFSDRWFFSPMIDFVSPFFSKA
jgi:hypothetical protein